MAVYKIFPNKDASIYTISQSMNTGIDEIIEASTNIQATRPQVSRYLIHFTDTEITNAFGRFDVSTDDYDIFFKNYTAVVTGLNLDQKLEIFPVSGSWGMGTGKYYNNPQTTNGVSWEFRNFSGSASEGALKWNMTSDRDWETFLIFDLN